MPGPQQPEHPDHGLHQRQVYGDGRPVHEPDCQQGRRGLAEGREVQRREILYHTCKELSAVHNASRVYAHVLLSFREGTHQGG